MSFGTWLNTEEIARRQAEETARRHAAASAGNMSSPVAPKQPVFGSQTAVPVTGDTVQVGQVSPTSTQPVFIADSTQALVNNWSETIDSQRPNGRTHYETLRQSGMSDDEAVNHLYADEERWAEQDAKYLRRQFERNPELLTQMQKDFVNLPPRLQKALLNEPAFRNGQKISESEMATMREALISDNVSMDVKAYALDKMYRSGLYSREQIEAFAKEANIAQDFILSRIRYGKRTQQALTISHLANNEETGELALNALPLVNKDVQNGVVSYITTSESYKNSVALQRKYMEVIPQLNKDVQAKAYNVGVESRYTDSSIKDEMRNYLNTLELPIEPTQVNQVEETSLSFDSVANKNNPFNLDINSVMASNPFASLIADVAPRTFSEHLAAGTLADFKPTTMQFIELLEKGEISPELVIQSGHTRALTSNFSRLSREAQSVVFDKLSNADIMRMYMKNQFSETFKEKALARLGNNLNPAIATALSRRLTLAELINFRSSAQTFEIQEIFNTALKERFPDYVNGQMS